MWPDFPPNYGKLYKKIKQYNTNFIIEGGVIDQKMKTDKWAPSLNVKYPLLTDYINKKFVKGKGSIKKIENFV